MTSDDEMSLADLGRTIFAHAKQATLATLDARDGAPYASIVDAGLTPDGSPLFLISQLASHTTNLKIDARCSIVARRPGPSELALARARVSVVGRAKRRERGEFRDAWIERHPRAEAYLALADFSFWSIEVERARVIAGFGRMDWLDAEAWAVGRVDPLTASAEGIIEHMNEDHAHNLLDYARYYADEPGAEAARMLSVDRLGFEIAVRRSGEPLEVVRRVEFAAPARDAGAVRAELVRMAHEARSS